jgi:hydroxymethylbilane synthase
MVAGLVGAALGVAVELVSLTTRGDRLQTASLAKLGGKGLFVKEIEEALLDGRADLAVHSAKDLPAQLHPDLFLAAFPERADPRDALVSRRRGAGFDALRAGARVGTGSVRRGAQLRAARPDLEIVPLRGNVPTRLRRLAELDLDAVILACAGLDRLGLSDRIDERIAPTRMLPAVAQGVLAIEGRRGDAVARDVAAIDHAETAACTRAERGLLAGLEADCTVPLAALAECAGSGQLQLQALLAASDGSELLRAEGQAPLAEGEALGGRLAADILARGGDRLLEQLRREAG